jgi:hypothetical protein
MRGGREATPETRWKFNYKAIPDFIALSETVKWDNVLSVRNVDEAVTNFYNQLYDLFDECFSSNNSNPKNRYPGWFSSVLVRKMDCKARCHRTWKKTKSNMAYNKFKALRLEVKGLVERDYRAHVERSERLIQTDPARFWNFVNRKRKLNQQPQCMFYDGKPHYGGASIADAFAVYFSSVFSLPSVGTPDDSAHESVSSSHRVDIPGIDCLDVMGGIKALKPKYSSGPDGVPPYILKQAGPTLISVLTHIFDLIARSRKFPEVWKTTRITPILKKGDATDVTNYRPIAVLSAPAKLFETIIHRIVFNACQSILIDEQHGFRPGRSTVTNLLCFDSFVSSSIDKGLQVDVNYNDFEKAFDRVDHRILLRKLSTLGFPLTYWNCLLVIFRAENNMLFMEECAPRIS